MKPKRIFIAATRQNDGKTSTALGLIFNLKEKFSSIGFIKPIGQRYLEEDGFKIDEDSILIERVCQACGISCELKDMSPIAVEKGFTEEYILNPCKNKITQQIQKSFGSIAQDKDLVIIEGTGHAGVGAVFDHSNATVARLLDSKVILVSSGGIGRPIDEILLNKALFEKEGVELLGVIINKVIPEKFDKINKLVREGLSRNGVTVLGVIPYYPLLSAPTISQVLEETNFQPLSVNKEVSDKKITQIIIGAMTPHEALNYIKPGSLVVTPGDREDIIMTVLSLHFYKTKDNSPSISGIILTGGLLPHPTIKDIMDKSDIPFLMAKEDTYTVASRLHDLTVKIRDKDTDKIQAVIEMVKEFVDVKQISEKL